MVKLMSELEQFQRDNEIDRHEHDVILMGDLNDSAHRRRSFHYLFDYLADKRFVHMRTDSDSYPATRVNGSQIDHIFVAKHLAEEGWTPESSFEVHSSDDPAEYRRTFSDHYPLTFMFEFEIEEPP